MAEIVVHGVVVGKQADASVFDYVPVVQKDWGFDFASLAAKLQNDGYRASLAPAAALPSGDAPATEQPDELPRPQPKL